MLKIGHRGTAALAPENTKAGFVKALKLGLDMVELDIQLTKDGEIVVIHDYDLERIAGVEDRVADLTLAQLRKIDIGSHFAAEFSKERIMTLEEVISLVKNDLQLNIELKMIEQKSELLIINLKQLLKEEDFVEEVVISSFNHCYLREFGPEFRTAILINSYPVNPVAMIESANADGIHPNYKLLRAKLIEEVHQAGYFVNTWTVNDEDEIKRLEELGVDGIVTDNPEIFIDRF